MPPFCKARCEDSPDERRVSTLLIDLISSNNPQYKWVSGYDFIAIARLCSLKVWAWFCAQMSRATLNQRRQFGQLNPSSAKGIKDEQVPSCDLL
jgi:hypothetical protein